MEELTRPSIQGNKAHPFASELNQLRKTALAQARAEPIANEDNQQRRM